MWEEVWLGQLRLVMLMFVLTMVLMRMGFIVLLFYGLGVEVGLVFGFGRLLRIHNCAILTKINIFYLVLQQSTILAARVMIII